MNHLGKNTNECTTTEKTTESTTTKNTNECTTTEMTTISTTRKNSEEHQIPSISFSLKSSENNEELQKSDKGNENNCDRNIALSPETKDAGISLGDNDIFIPGEVLLCSISDNGSCGGVQGEMQDGIRIKKFEDEKLTAATKSTSTSTTSTTITTFSVESAEYPTPMMTTTTAGMLKPQHCIDGKPLCSPQSSGSFESSASYQSDVVPSLHDEREQTRLEESGSEFISSSTPDSTKDERSLGCLTLSVECCEQPRPPTYISVEPPAAKPVDSIQCLGNTKIPSNSMGTSNNDSATLAVHNFPQRQMESKIPRYSLNTPITPHLKSKLFKTTNTATATVQNENTVNHEDCYEYYSECHMRGKAIGTQAEGFCESAAEVEVQHVEGSPPESTNDIPREPDIEVNFFLNPTMLSRQILFQKFGNAIRHVQKYPKEASVWVCAKRELEQKIATSAHKEDLVTGSEKQTSYITNTTMSYYSIRQLPIHAACASLASTLDTKLRGNLELLILHLVKLYPEGCGRVDHQGKLPLHEAILNNGNPQTITMLIMAYPKAIRQKDKYGNFPNELNQQRSGDNKKEISDLLKLGVKVWEEVRDESNLRSLKYPEQTAIATRKLDSTDSTEYGNEIEHEEIIPMAWDQLEKRAILLERMLTEIHEKNFQLDNKVQKLKHEIALASAPEETENQIRTPKDSIVSTENNSSFYTPQKKQNDGENTGAASRYTALSTTALHRYNRSGPAFSARSPQISRLHQAWKGTRSPLLSIEKSSRRRRYLPSLEEENDDDEDNNEILKSQLPALAELEDNVEKAVARARERVHEYRLVHPGSLKSSGNLNNSFDGESVDSTSSLTSRKSFEESIARARERVRQHRHLQEKEIIKEIINTML